MTFMTVEKLREFDHIDFKKCGIENQYGGFVYFWEIWEYLESLQATKDGLENDTERNAWLKENFGNCVQEDLK